RVAGRKGAGPPCDAATAPLPGLGRTVAQTPKASTTVPAGSVISQSLPQGAGAVNGQTIILTVSTGPPSAPVPDVSNKGYTFDQASQILQQAGFQAVLVADFPAARARFRRPPPAPRSRWVPRCSSGSRRRGRDPTGGRGGPAARSARPGRGWPRPLGAAAYRRGCRRGGAGLRRQPARLGTVARRPGAGRRVPRGLRAA